MNTSNEMKIALLTFALISLLEPAVCQKQWLSTRSGCEVRNDTLPDHGSQVSYILVRCDPKSVQIGLVDTANVLGKGNGYAAFSLREIADKTGASIVANAGSTTSFSLPVPAGLLIVEGKVVGKAKLHAPNAGVVCIRRDQITIEPVSTTLPKGCSDAVERGPIFSRDFSNNSTTRYRRTVAAVDTQGRFIIVLTKQTLSSINSFLYDANSDLKINSALNLDGDSSSGLIFASDEGVSERTFGTVDGLIASAITIRRR